MLNENDAIKQKLRWAIDVAGVTRDTLQTATDLKSKSGVSEWLRTGRIAKKHLPILARLTGTSDRWWLTKDAPIPPSGEWLATVAISAPPTDQGNAQPETMRPYPSGNRIPVVGTAQLGDNGHFVELEYPVGHGDGYVDIASRDPNAYALRCRGDSMKPRIQAGEFVVIEPNQEAVPGDEVLVKATDGRVMVKRYLYRRDGRVHLLSVNEAHGPTALEESEVEAMHYVAAIVKAARWVTG